MIYIEKQDIHSTLTTWIYCSFWQAWVDERMGKPYYINWPKGKSLIDLEDLWKFNENPNMYQWYFRQPPQIQVGLNVLEIDNKIETWTWETWQDPSGTGGLYAQPLDEIKRFYKSHLIFNSDTEWRGLALKNKYNIDFDNTIGITWRGTDIYLESLNGNDGRKYTPIEAYYKWIDKALEENPNMRIACTAEEEGILDPLLARYPQAFKIEEFYQSPKGGKHNPERFSPLSGYERGLQPALIVWFFSKCKWYIKNRSSTGAVASWLSDGNIVCIGHPENLGYDKMHDEVEFKGERYPI